MTYTNQIKIALQVDGWRHISHSYALVNQFQLLALHRNNLASIRHNDMPYVMAHWASRENSAGFNEQDKKIIEEISEPVEPAALYRIHAPFGVDISITMPTVTFAVTEFGYDDSKYDQASVDRYTQEGGKIHTPSQWSKNRLVARGVPEGIIHVIGHAVDSKYFFQMPQSEISANRTAIGYEEDDIVLLNVGTHHWNKGLDLLVTAFAQAHKKNRRLKLLLKDQRSTYLMNSEDYVKKVLINAGVQDQETLGSVRFLSSHLTLSQLNAVYNVADRYVTPYRAEGFNLPALEAKACGTTVIATRGGATDDFLADSDTIFLDGQLHENAPLPNGPRINAYIEPDLHQLVDTLVTTQGREKTKNAQAVSSWVDPVEKLCQLLV